MRWRYLEKEFQKRIVSYELRDGYLREEEWGMAYGFASELLHAGNPFDLSALSIRSEPPALSAFERRLHEYFTKVVALLNHHVVNLPDRDTFLACLMLTEQGGVQVAVFQRTDESFPAD